MKPHRVARISPLLAAFLIAGSLSADQPRVETLQQKVEAAVVGSPLYGPFDVVSIEVTGDTVTLGGHVYRPVLKGQTEKAVVAIPGVAHVVNAIEVLPVSLEDDRLRRAVFFTIYRDIGLAKYGTPLASLTQGRTARGLHPGSVDGIEPLGNYAIHVVVKGGRVTLYGLVENATDREKATMQARGVFGVKSIENRIDVRRPAPPVDPASV
ncbi:MAG: BON domain-containing protein [Acidobacteriota bacterium]